MATPERPLKLGEHYLDIGQPARALEIMRQMAGAELENPRYWYLRGRALYALDRHAEAAQALRVGLKRAPWDVQLLHLLSCAEQQQGNLAAAERAVLAALQLAPENPALLSQYGLLVAQGGQLAKAQRLVEMAARLDPENVYVGRARTAVAYLQGDDRAANRHGREILTQAPEDDVAHYMVGAALSEQGEVSGAKKHFTTAASLNPEQQAFREAVLQSRYYTHWLLWPLRPFNRWGTVRVWMGAMAILLTLEALGQSRAAFIFAIAYIALCVYSWVVPPLLRWWMWRGRRS